MILCDTNILLEVYKENNIIIEILKKIGQVNIAISDVTCGELLYGARNKTELKVIKNDINNLISLPINSDISKLAILLIEKFSLSHNLSLPDALISSTAIYHNVKLFTLNKKDFKFINNLQLLELEL